MKTKYRSIRSDCLLKLLALASCTILTQVESYRSCSFRDRRAGFKVTMIDGVPENFESQTSVGQGIPDRKWNKRKESAKPKTVYDIWAGLSTESLHSPALAETVTSARKRAIERSCIRPVVPIDEQTRYEAYSRLRQRMFDLVRGENCDSRRGWVRSFERWQYLSKNFEWSHEHTQHVGNLAFLDPLLPSVYQNNPAEQNLFEDLKKLENMSVDSASRVSRSIQRDSAYLSDQLFKRMMLRISKERDQTANLYSVNVVPNKNNGDLKISLEGCSGIETSGARHRVFTISAAHALKLQLMFDWNKLDQSTGGFESQGRDGENVAARNDKSVDFDNHLFCVLARYSMLEGYGWQAAVAQTVLRALQKDFGVSVECFSSPLNTYLPSYCSLFPDTDAHFGSLGSFFDLNPSEGSFQANPPFVSSLMVQMVDRMEHLLAAATGPMSFAVVVPAWVEDPHWERLTSSAFNRGQFTVAAAEHSYCDGGQHENSIVQDFRPAPFDTAVFFLQNVAGSEKWPQSVESEARLRSAFAEAKPSEETLRNQREKGLYVPKSKAQK
jgi:phosphorylated CTD-interacting factor 1